MTQFGRAMAELNIEIICANSSQAKGRVERVNRTLQDRLAGNAFLPSFLLTHNERFAVTPGPAPRRHAPAPSQSRQTSSPISSAIASSATWAAN